ncbi:LysR family transcriptional regulator [Janthinobacterium agaricidamnosum]|uniref:Bacterial regulatory helix-turn-helix, lysR family protein n=1 Tax=Janthinobacterium agaricidamnosum NBRC 102515 = DSM 9628 TaxID=1349767 RepID=W0V7P8_9BURK|nr:LysR family transcriptional regulator [Janthinobacterium agaricidamnosum]CDG83292.1 bacterial regulatory helix-turn-helix, lysR family protein [Janthinobacterium agaricidamnosum NBRC 102515 = DSM 9628]
MMSLPHTELASNTRALYLPGLFAFESVARHMNFSRAAVEMGVTPTAISRTVKVLEEQLNVRLFNRTTRSVALTEAGAQLLDTLAPALEQIRNSVQQAGLSADQPVGLLRINTSYVAYRTLIEPHLESFLAQHPGVNVELALDNQLSDVVGEGYDAGIRLGHAIQRDMIAVLLGGAQLRTLVAAPSYLQRHGAPKTPHDLLNHACIRQRFPDSGRPFEWRFQNGREITQIDVQGRLVFDEMRSAQEAAVRGLGIAYVFEDFARADIDSGRLLPLLERSRVAGSAFYLYYPNRAHMPGKLRAFIDFMQAANRPPAQDSHA